MTGQDYRAQAEHVVWNADTETAGGIIEAAANTVLLSYKEGHPSRWWNFLAAKKVLDRYGQLGIVMDLGAYTPAGPTYLQVQVYQGGRMDLYFRPDGLEMIKTMEPVNFEGFVNELYLWTKEC